MTNQVPFPPAGPTGPGGPTGPNASPDQGQYRDQYQYGQTPGQGPWQAPPRGHWADSFARSVGRLRLWRTDDRWFGGVAAGLAHRFGVDPLLIRACFVVLTLAGGLGLFVYGIGWALLPEASDGRIHFIEVTRGRCTAGFIGACIFVFLSLVGTPLFFGTTGGWGWAFDAVLIIVAVIIALALRDRVAPRAPQPSPYQQPQAAAAPFAPSATAPVPGPDGAASPTAATATFPEGTPMSTSDGGPSAQYPISPAAGVSQAGPQRVSAMPAGPATQAGPPYPAGAPTSAAPYSQGYGPARPAGYTAGYGPARPAGYGPYADGRTQPMPAQAQPVKPHAHVATGVVAALILFIIAGAILLRRYTHGLDHVFVPGLVVAAILVLVGLVIVGRAVFGMRSGGLTALGIVAIIVSLPLTALFALTGGSVAIGDRSWTPVGNEVAGDYQMGIGRAALDLTSLGATGHSAADPLRITYQMGIGQATLIVPEAMAVEVKADNNIGDIEGWFADDWRLTWRGTGSNDGVTVTSQSADNSVVQKLDDWDDDWDHDWDHDRDLNANPDSQDYEDYVESHLPIPNAGTHHWAYGGVGTGLTVESPTAVKSGATVVVTINQSIGQLRIIDRTAAAPQVPATPSATPTPAQTPSAAGTATASAAPTAGAAPTAATTQEPAAPSAPAQAALPTPSDTHTRG
ncbi:MAG: PspC domain-containing protein [Bifidobacteriaceae bacterium]|jgi:phage shock protein PspC (stress-responsive transcriptional regulator)|nr:PspC domain-containing protein [Bifidobacteriaceae bacterium]